MKSRLGRIFVIQVSVFVAAIIVVSYLMFYRLEVRNMQERVTTDFRAELQIMAQEIGHRVDIAVENTAAMSSRTMIRAALASYHNGDLSLADVRDYTQAKYEDGASVYKNLLFARRTYLDDTLIALYGDPAPGPGDIPAGTSLTFFRHDGSYALFVRRPLVHEGIFLGHDAAVFTLGVVDRTDALFLENQRVLPDSDIENGRDAFSLSSPIGNTGWFLHADLNEDILKQEVATIRGSVLLLSAALILSVLVLSYFTILRLTFRLLRERDEVNKRLSGLVKEKSYLLKELHHRVKNNLNLVTSFIGLQSSVSDNRELEERNQVLISRINAISLVHEKLQHSDGIQDVDIGMYLRELCQRIIESYNQGAISLTADTAEVIVVPINRAISIGLIFAELTINSLKHAIVSGQLHVSIGVRPKADGILFTFTDDGKPFPEDFSPSAGTSLGLKVVESLAEQLEGSIEYDPGREKMIRLKVPFDRMSST